MKAYKEPTEIECLAGDTLPEMKITVVGADDLSGMTMTGKIIAVKNPNLILKTIPCTAAEGGFTAQIGTAHTRGLDGEYWLDFVLEGASGELYKKLRIPLTVRKSCRGA